MAAETPNLSELGSIPRVRATYASKVLRIAQQATDLQVKVRIFIEAPNSISIVTRGSFCTYTIHILYSDMYLSCVEALFKRCVTGSTPVMFTNYQLSNSKGRDLDDAGSIPA